MSDEFDFFFNIYVHDDRYAVPTLRFFVAADGLAARELASNVLKESLHHRGVEVRLGDRRVAAVGACSDGSI